jgi:hypothetical protein
MKKFIFTLSTTMVLIMLTNSCSKDKDSPEPAPVVNTTPTPNNPQPTNGLCTAIIDGVPFTASAITASLVYNPSIPDPWGGPPSAESNVLRINASNSSSTLIDIRFIWYTAQNQIYPISMTDVTSLAWQMTTEVTFTVNGSHYRNPQSGELNILSVDTINRLISGTFIVSARNDDPIYVFHNLTNGVFTNVHY